MTDLLTGNTTMTDGASEGLTNLTSGLVLR